MSISGVVKLSRHSLSLLSRSRQSNFLSVVFVLIILLVEEENNQIRVFLSPKKEKAQKICSPCPSRVSAVSSRVSAVSEPYPNQLTYCLVNDTPRGVSDTYPTCIRCVSACPRVRYTDTEQGSRVRLLRTIRKPRNSLLTKENRHLKT